MSLEPDRVESGEICDEAQLVMVTGWAAARRSRDGDVVAFAEDVVGELETDDGIVKRFQKLRA